MLPANGPSPMNNEKPGTWHSPDHALLQAIQTAENEKVVTSIGLDLDVEETVAEVMAKAPRLSKIPLDSVGGLSAVETALRQTTIEPTPVAIEFFTENWLHPRLARWGREQGFVASTDPIRLDDRVGHFDHAPYAFDSSFGKTVHPTPHQTATHGRVFFIEWDRRSKAYEIVSQVLAAAREFAQEGDGARRASSGPFPPRNQADGELEADLLRNLHNLREAFGVGPGTGNSAGYGHHLLDSGVEALVALVSPTTPEIIKSATTHSQASRGRLVAALERLWPLSDVLDESRAAWEQEVEMREQWMADFHTNRVGA
jgi:hypothetical protein